MSYIGNTPTNQNFVAGADQFSGTGSQLAFTLSRNVNTVFDMFVTVSNVPQDPFTAYTVAGNTLTFDSAPPSGTNNIDVVYRATNVQTFVPSPGATVGGSFGIQGNLNFYGTGNRITGDFSNATLANRVMFQTSTVNGTTSIATLPNGTNATSSVLAFGGSDPANAPFTGFNNTATESQILASKIGTGTYLPMTFYTGGSERMRVDTSGNVGIGTSSPSYLLHTVGNTNGSITNGVTNSNSGTDAAARFIAIADAGSAVFGMTSSGYTGITGAQDAMLLNAGNASGGIAFALDGVLKAKIDSSGRLMVNTTVTSFGSSEILSIGAGAVGVVGTSSTSVYSLYIQNTAGSGASSPMIRFSTSNGVSGTIISTTTSTTYATSSDYRLKHDIAPMTGALAKIAALKPVTYKWNADNSEGEGFIAHELQAVCPDAVTGEKDGADENGDAIYQGIDTSFLVATLTAAIQELKAEVDQLRAQLEAK